MRGRVTLALRSLGTGCVFALVSTGQARGAEPKTPAAKPAFSMALRGKVIDSAGQPVTAARVDIATAAPRIGQGIFCPSCYRDCAKWTETDDAGQFELRELDPMLKFQLLCTAPGKEAHLSKLIDPLLGSLTITLEPAPTDLPPERTIRRRIVDAQGTPIRAALVSPWGAKEGERRWWGVVENCRAAVSDRDGRFTMLVPEGLEGVDLEIVADGYAGVQAELVAPGQEEQPIVVPRGARVTGTLIFEGKPAAAARIAVVQMDRGASNHFIKAVEATTDAEGHFAFDYLPASQPYAIFTPLTGKDEGPVLTTKKFTVPADGESRDLGTLTMIPALHLTGRVELPPGQTLPRGARLSLDRDPAWDLAQVEISAGGRFKATGLAPETYELRFPIKDFAVDSAALNYQALSDQSFGIRITESIDDLRVPLRAAPAK